MKYKNISILLTKIKALFFLLFIIYISNMQKIKIKNLLEDYFSLIICKFINIGKSDKIISNIKCNDNIKKIKQQIELLINIKKTKIESVFMLIGLFPFLTNNSTITFRIHDREIYILFKYIFKNKKIRKSNKFSIFDFHIVNAKFNALINYKWELIPNQKIQKILRYIINNYYNETCLYIFDKSLNLNLKYFIKRKKNELSIKKLKQLMCKYNDILLFMK